MTSFGTTSKWSTLNEELLEIWESQYGVKSVPCRASFSRKLARERQGCKRAPPHTWKIRRSFRRYYLYLTDMANELERLLDDTICLAESGQSIRNNRKCRFYVLRKAKTIPSRYFVRLLAYKDLCKKQTRKVGRGFQRLCQSQHTVNRGRGCVGDTSRPISGRRHQEISIYWLPNQNEEQLNQNLQLRTQQGVLLVEKVNGIVQQIDASVVSSEGQSEERCTFA